MKKIILSSVIVVGISCTTPAYAKDPCGSILCLAGMLAGQDGGASCAGYINDYFSLLSFGKKWKFRPDATLNLRASFLNGCASPGNDDIKNQINNRYGKLRFRP